MKRFIYMVRDSLVKMKDSNIINVFLGIIIA